MRCGSSHGLRVISAVITSAVRWSGRTSASAPLILPIAVRQASTAKTADISHLPRSGLLAQVRLAHDNRLGRRAGIRERSARARRSRQQASQTRIDRIDKRPVPWILPARPHLSGDVPDGDVSFWIAATERATGAEVPERSGPAAHRPLWLGELEAEAKPRRAVQDQVRAFRLLAGSVGERT